MNKDPVSPLGRDSKRTVLNQQTVFQVAYLSCGTVTRIPVEMCCQVQNSFVDTN
uniref:Uncharacterized protein n=1 Tax=Arundo donax TaxID=35708 RepID=A0A0A8ZKC8_ARUDO